MTTIQSLFSTTAGTVMVLAILAILAIACVILGLALVKKTNKLYYYEDDSMTTTILESRLRLAKNLADQYDDLSYLLFRILYELIGESEATTANHKLMVFRSSHLLLDTDLREGAQIIMKKINSDDPDTESIIQYIMSIMDVFGGYQAMSTLGKDDYRTTIRNIVELQETIKLEEDQLSRLYEQEREEDQHQLATPTEKRNFLEWFKILISGLKHPNDYYEDEEDDS